MYEAFVCITWCTYTFFVQGLFHSSLCLAHVKLWLGCFCTTGWGECTWAWGGAPVGQCISGGLYALKLYAILAITAGLLANSCFQSNWTAKHSIHLMCNTAAGWAHKASTGCTLHPTLHCLLAQNNTLPLQTLVFYLILQCYKHFINCFLSTWYVLWKLQYLVNEMADYNIIHIWGLYCE